LRGTPTLRHLCKLTHAGPTTATLPPARPSPTSRLAAAEGWVAVAYAEEVHPDRRAMWPRFTLRSPRS
jgi:hypothetical protein